MAKDKVASGFINHMGMVINVQDAMSMSEADFVKQSIEQSAAQAAGVHVNFSNMGEQQTQMLKDAYQAAKAEADKSKPAEPKAPAKTKEA